MAINGIVQSKMKILSLFTHPQVALLKKTKENILHKKIFWRLWITSWCLVTQNPQNSFHPHHKPMPNQWSLKIKACQTVGQSIVFRQQRGWLKCSHLYSGHYYQSMPSKCQNTGLNRRKLIYLSIKAHYYNDLISICWDVWIFMNSYALIWQQW